MHTRGAAVGFTRACLESLRTGKPSPMDTIIDAMPMAEVKFDVTSLSLRVAPVPLLLGETLADGYAEVLTVKLTRTGADTDAETLAVALHSGIADTVAELEQSCCNDEDTNGTGLELTLRLRQAAADGPIKEVGDTDALA